MGVYGLGAGSCHSECPSCGGGGGGTSCSPCTIPNSNLTVSWANFISGNGTDTLVYSGGASPTWTTGCSGPGPDYEFHLDCAGGVTELRVIYFTSGFCPTGGSSFCSNLLSGSQKLTLDSSQCSPFELVFDCTSCSALSGAGFTTITITL